MRGYFEPPEFYEDATRSDYVHVDEIPNIPSMKENLKKIFEVIYGDGDVEDIEVELEEMAKELEMKLPWKPLRIAKKNLPKIKWGTLKNTTIKK